MTEDIKNADGSVTHVVTEQDHAEGKFTDVEIGASATFMPAGVARLYEIGNKTTGVFEPVNHDGSGDVDGDMDADFICHKEDGSEVVFKREGQDENGNAIFVNPEFVIRDRETKLALDGVTPVADIEVAPAAETKPEGEASATGANAPVEAVYFSVYDTAGTFVRRYSSVEHGDETTAKELADNFAAKIKGTVKVG